MSKRFELNFIFFISTLISAQNIEELSITKNSRDALDSNFFNLLLQYIAAHWLLQIQFSQHIMSSLIVPGKKVRLAYSN